ncbi:hypothetical protein DTO271G3_3683 [Paecilomyces variotii]|nr:hypothetical protein DTO271G3_3683 [Paecilomyces variotii]
MHTHLFMGLLLALLASLGSGSSVSKWSLAHNWNTTNTDFLRDTSTPVHNVSLTAPVVLTHVATLIETVTVTSPVTVTAMTTVTGTITFPPDTVYVTLTVVDPTLGCIISLPTAPGTVADVPHIDSRSETSTSTSYDEDYRVTSFFTSTETIQVISAPKLSATPEVTGVLPCNRPSSDHHAISQPSEASSSDTAAASTETITVWPVPEESTSTQETTTSVTSTIMNVVTKTRSPVSQSSTSSAMKLATLPSTGFSTSYQNVTYASTASSLSASIFTRFRSIISISAPATNRTMRVRRVPKREIDTWVTATINGDTASSGKKYNALVPSWSPVTGKNPGGPAISAMGTVPSPIKMSSSATTPTFTPTSPLVPCGEVADFKIGVGGIITPQGSTGN